MNKLNRNLISHYRLNGMFMRLFLSVMLVVSFMVAISSCSGDDKDDEPVTDPASELYGAWEASLPSNRPLQIVGVVSKIVFETKSILSSTVDYLDIPRPGGSYDIPGDRIDYRYEIFGNTIKIFRLANSTKSPDSVLSYKLIGDKLTLECISGEVPSFLECFTDKAVTFTRK